MWVVPAICLNTPAPLPPLNGECGKFWRQLRQRRGDFAVLYLFRLTFNGWITDYFKILLQVKAGESYVNKLGIAGYMIDDADFRKRNF
jgi:hypothetical protein